MISRAPK